MKRVYVIVIIITCLTGTFFSIQAMMRMGIKWLINAPFGNSIIASTYGNYNSVISKYEFITKNIKDMLEKVTTTNITVNEQITGMIGLFKKHVIHTNNREILPYDTEKMVLLENTADKMSAFAGYLEDRGIRFGYVQIPDKSRFLQTSDKTQNMGTGLGSSDITRADMLVALFEQKGVRVCDLSKNQGIIDSITFDDTDHWSSESALYATSIIDAFLVDMGILSRDDLEILNHTQYYNVLSDVSVPYDYYMPVPCNTSEYEVTAIDNSGMTTYTGDFVDTLLKDRELWHEDNGAYHDLWRQKNGMVISINNKGAICGRRLLVLGDSFSWPVVAYMTQAFEYVDAFYPPNFDGSIKKYIITKCPDVVMVVYSDVQAQHDDKDYSSIAAAYEFGK